MLKAGPHLVVVLLLAAPLSLAAGEDNVLVEDRAVVVVNPAATVEELLHTASEAYEALEYEVCLAHATAALSRAGITDDQRVTAYALQAGSHAVMGQQLDAEREYRLLIRLRPEFKLPDTTPPKILAAWRVVDAEEELIRRTVRHAQRERMINAITLKVDAPQSHRGGAPLDIRVKISDPYAGIAQLVLAYRTEPTAGFSTLPFEKRGEDFVARFSAAQTSSEAGFALDYAILARDAEGQVVASSGTEALPQTIRVTAGYKPAPPLWRQPASWIVAGSYAAVVAAVTSAVVITAMVAFSSVVSASYLLARGDGTAAAPLGKQRFP